MVSCLATLKQVHAKGVVHGDIHGGNFVYSDAETNFRNTLRLIDFERATTYLTADGVHIEEPEEPPRYVKQSNTRLASVWELEGGHLSRRDDLYRLAELGLALSSDAFMVDWTAPGAPPECAENESMDSCRAHVAKLKRKRSPAGGVVYCRLYNAVLELKFHETINYDFWMQEISKSEHP